MLKYDIMEQSRVYGEDNQIYGKTYLMILEELQDENLYQECMTWLDPHRRQRAAQHRLQEKRIEAVGAGLLLQLAVREWMQGAAESQDELRVLTPRQVVAALKRHETALSLEYRYGEQGKPYLEGIPLFFSLSHSGHYALCAVSEREIGADIQEKKEPFRANIVERFYAPGEAEEYRKLVQQESEPVGSGLTDWFYRLWCRKESWGKLTGRGVGEVLRKDCREKSEVTWQEWNTQDGYRVAVCVADKVEPSDAGI